MGYSSGGGPTFGAPSQPVWGTSNSSPTSGISIGSGTIATIASVAATAYSYYRQQEAQKDVEKLQRLSYKAQLSAKAEQSASNASKAARETRAQIREERVRRARIIQASINTGTAGSSGEIGSTGGLATQLGSNLGFMKGQVQHAEAISEANQSASDFLSAAQNKTNSANQWGQIGQLGTSIFGATGGFTTLKNIFSGTPEKKNS